MNPKQMNILITSDCHCEFHADKGNKFCIKLTKEANNNRVGAIVIAGDLDIGEHLHTTLRVILENTDIPIVYVPGNHEYYYTNYETVDNILHTIQQQFTHFHPLHNSDVIIHGYRFIGATMWFPDDPLNVVYEKRLNDFHLIKDLKDWVYDENRHSVKYLSNIMRQGDIVVTHHAPSDKSRDPRYEPNDPFNRFYITNMERVICEKQPNVWIHGHMHNRQNYKIHRTQIVSAPFGYAGREKTMPPKIFELQGDPD